MEVERHEVSPIGSRVNTVVLAFTVVAGLVVSLRLFTRLFLTKVSGFEDVWIVLAMVGLTDTSSLHDLTNLRGFRSVLPQQSQSKRCMGLENTCHSSVLVSA
jgi:hypothetical protein